jgi:pimeloyl-ACP methyl ester carboxylesterase
MSRSTPHNVALVRLIPGEKVATLQFDDVTIAYETEGEGVPLVFIHQVATDQRIWHHQYAHFRSRYRPITVDILGHGQSAWPPQAFSIEQAAYRLHQFLERLGTGPVFLIGVSMGAVVALQMALHAPQLVRGLGLVSPWDHTDGDMQTLINRLFRLADVGDIAAYADLFLSRVFPIEFASQHPVEAEQVQALIVGQQPAAVAYTWVACRATDLRHQLGQIRAPSLVIAGLNDLFAPPYLARGVAEKLSEVELEIWEEAGHFPFLENPQRFNRRLEVFIERCLARAGATS